VAAGVVPVGVLGQVRLPVPVPVLESDEVLGVEPELRLRALVAAEHGVEQNVTADRDPLVGGADGDVMGDVASRAVAGEEDAGAGVVPAAEAGLRHDPLERGPSVVVGAGVPVLGRAAVVDGHDDAVAELDEPAAQLVVDGGAGGGVREAAAVEEEDDRERVRGRRAGEEVEDGQGDRGGALGRAGVVSRGGAVDADLEADGGVDDVVEGRDALRGARVGRQPAVEVLGEVAVEGAVRAPEHVVRHLEVGDEHPCVERHRRLREASSQGTVRRTGLLDFSSRTHPPIPLPFPRMGTNAMRGGNPRPPLGRKDASLGHDWSLALSDCWVAVSPNSHSHHSQNNRAERGKKGRD
jgi:hypothetical protein